MRVVFWEVRFEQKGGLSVSVYKFVPTIPGNLVNKFFCTENNIDRFNVCLLCLLSPTFTDALAHPSPAPFSVPFTPQKIRRISPLRDISPPLEPPTSAAAAPSALQRSKLTVAPYWFAALVLALGAERVTVRRAQVVDLHDDGAGTAQSLAGTVRRRGQPTAGAACRTRALARTDAEEGLRGGGLEAGLVWK